MLKSTRKSTRKSSRKSTRNTTQFYSLEKRFFKINGKVFENTTTETKNNIMHKKGYINGKKINKTRKFKSLIPDFINKSKF
jgi:hypothetical protein